MACHSPLSLYYYYTTYYLLLYIFCVKVLYVMPFYATGYYYYIQAVVIIQFHLLWLPLLTFCFSFDSFRCFDIDFDYYLFLVLFLIFLLQKHTAFLRLAFIIKRPRQALAAATSRAIFAFHREDYSSHASVRAFRWPTFDSQRRAETNFAFAIISRGKNIWDI